MQVRFPVRAHTYVAGLVPSLDGYRRQPIDVQCFSLSPPLLLPLSTSNEKMSSGEDLKKKIQLSIYTSVHFSTFLPSLGTKLPTVCPRFIKDPWRTFSKQQCLGSISEQVRFPGGGGLISIRELVRIQNLRPHCRPIPSKYAF